MPSSVSRHSNHIQEISVIRAARETGQSITRTRWLTVKLALIGAAAMAVTEAFSLLQAWWAAPIGKAVGLGGSTSIFSETRW